MNNIVDINFLKGKMKNKSVVIFDVRHKLEDKAYGKYEYDKGHIPSAIFIPFEILVDNEIAKHGGRHPLPDMDVFAKEINEMGVDDSIDVVVYDDGDYSMAGRLWFMLKLIGKENVYILKNGINAWVEEKNTMELAPNLGNKGGVLTIDFKDYLLVSIDEIKNAISSQNTVIVDSRAEERYKGIHEPIDKIAGHIPSAVNYPWMDVLEYSDASMEELNQYYEALSDFEDIVLYCGSGITATVNMIFLEEAGYKPRLYSGGFSDWISYEENEIACDL